MTDADEVPVVIGASGLIVRDGKVLLVRRGKQPYKDHWSLPGGALARGEPAREAVRREVREETGLEVEVGGIAARREEITAHGRFVVTAFHCTVVGGRLRAGDDAAECEFVEPVAAARRRCTPGLGEVLRDAVIASGPIAGDPPDGGTST